MWIEKAKKKKNKQNVESPIKIQIISIWILSWSVRFGEVNFYRAANICSKTWLWRELHCINIYKWIVTNGCRYFKILI